MNKHFSWCSRTFGREVVPGSRSLCLSLVFIQTTSEFAFHFVWVFFFNAALLQMQAVFTYLL